MAGTLPRTALLLTHHGVVEGHFSSYSDIARYLGISVSTSGVVSFFGEVQKPVYIMYSKDPINGFEHSEDVLKNWANSYMEKHLNDRSYRIYRYLA